ncbi:NAD(P)H-dependent oxidoreductase [Novosphingobium sp.]|uniref:FMN-dependent NADH-azoreductase n=1 Tax=Novosphingobium sp. TaxID=1874826 RepID=UPI0026324690|nr:NAD(P)H-dependent oxidoreductase [Novosphingobium sp.]
MARLLHISASPRGDRSRSDKVARRLIAGLGAAEVETLDLAAAALPAFDGAAIEGRYDLIEGRAVDPAVIAAWEGIRATVAHFLSFDTHVFSVPMWNFGVPWRLKQYIDVLTQPGLAFTVSAEGVTGLAAGRRAVLVCSGALDIRPGQPGAELDFQTAYMRAWLGFIGVTDVHELQVRPTYGSPAEVEAAMARAYAEADTLAAALRG